MIFSLCCTCCGSNDGQEQVTEEFKASSLLAVLAAPVSALAGVSPEAVTWLSTAGVSSVMGLAAWSPGRAAVAIAAAAAFEEGATDQKLPLARKAAAGEHSTPTEATVEKEPTEAVVNGKDPADEEMVVEEGSTQEPTDDNVAAAAATVAATAAAAAAVAAAAAATAEAAATVAEEEGEAQAETPLAMGDDAVGAGKDAQVEMDETKNDDVEDVDEE